MSTLVHASAAPRAGVAWAVRPAAFVRITHWIHAAAFAGLVVSGGAILIAHPWLYWGETGAVEAPSLVDLPIPFLLGHSGWGRYLHFQSAWICVLTGLVYVAAGIATRHFERELAPRRAAAVPVIDDEREYNPIQRIAYLGVVFVLLPLAIATGLAMSPAIASVYPMLVTTFGGQQSARTLHFGVAVALVLFTIVHITMVARAGFVRRTRAMITGRLD